MTTGNLQDTELYHQLQTGKEALGGAIHARPLRYAAMGSTWVGTVLAVRCAMAAPIGEALLGGAIAAAGVFLVSVVVYLAIRGQLFADHPTPVRDATEDVGHTIPSCAASSAVSPRSQSPSAMS